ncbi:tryptophan 7-halogenase [Simiduia sp. 21SJ11W-1]|uniref:tryptophan halogenase family protein n=1 Tax=Simiduia sp. 21SJ11W-1 TaxID=2909669 RepID=UPI0020A16363|nr:tryptophan halogenase family protein [Simiduia sp. 21SJ11W-1]UTA47725.1 tryptophan 7-halogenase [Simiduia sp. 21SJ11W-1]
MSDNIKRVLILGGGTAGWMAANLMAHHWKDKPIEITLVESPDIGIIGVGEGTTPPFKNFLDTIGLRDEDWMVKCNATYKNGIRFNDWSVKPGFETYFHPFYAKTDDHTVPAFFHNSFLIRKGVDLEGHPDHFFLQPVLARKKLAPLPVENFPFETTYGFHFDSGLFGKFLGEYAQSKGVKYIQATVDEVILNDKGFVSHLTTKEAGNLHADLFVDSSGFNGKIIKKALNEPFIDFSKSLFNDSAVVMPTPQGDDPNCQTTSTAMKYGWRWDIPLTNRIGNGYVYSGRFCDKDKAETELREALGMLDSDVEARHLKFTVGRVQRHWVKNCVAIGLSQGFVEPLEATALDMVNETIYRFIQAYNAGDYTDEGQRLFNEHISKRFDAIKDYIVAHFRIVSRRDSDYWQEVGNNENISDSLRAILMSWMQGQNITQLLETHSLDAYFPNISWNCLLTGKGIYPDKHQLRPGNEEANKYNINKIEEFIDKCSMNFPRHKDRLMELQLAAKG